MSKYVDVEAVAIAYSGHTPDDEYSQGVDFVLDKLESMPAADVVSWDWLLGYAANSWSRTQYTDFLSSAKEAYKEASND